MAAQMTFQRYELKYLLTRRQKDKLVQAMEPYMQLDRFGHSTIRNIYYDTDNFRLIRRSLERPAYKEKLRVRSYSRADAEDPVFVEMKKKYRSIVYKRRLTLPREQAARCLAGQEDFPVQSQIAREIEYFLQFYRTLAPAVFLSYEREAFCTLEKSDFRVTFDENILYRREELSLGGEIWGTPVLQPDQVLLEIKTAGGIPLWMSHFLTGEHIYKTSFSKYGSAYRHMLGSCLSEGRKLYA